MGPPNWNPSVSNVRLTYSCLNIITWCVPQRWPCHAPALLFIIVCPALLPYRMSPNRSVRHRSVAPVLTIYNIINILQSVAVDRFYNALRIKYRIIFHIFIRIYSPTRCRCTSWALLLIPPLCIAIMGYFHFITICNNSMSNNLPKQFWVFIFQCI